MAAAVGFWEEEACFLEMVDWCYHRLLEGEADLILYALWSFYAPTLSLQNSTHLTSFT